MIETTTSGFPGTIEKQYLFITRGLPASGKSTAARKFRDRDKANRVIVEKDKLRLMTGDGYVAENEYLIHKTSVNQTRQFLEAGKTVIVSDTNLPNKTVKSYLEVAGDLAVAVWIVDMTDVDVRLCHSRNLSRASNYPPDNVPDHVIDTMYTKFIKGRNYPLSVPQVKSGSSVQWEYYYDDPALQTAIIVDIDGTLASMNNRSPYDWHRVHEDTPRAAVEDLLRVYKDSVPYVRIILMSGRDSAAREGTERWLEDNQIPYDELHMRAAGDTRKDDLVKYELFNQHVRDQYRVWMVLDDRDQVVKMWRAMGLDCFQVAEGNF
jgi:predicted kinase